MTHPEDPGPSFSTTGTQADPRPVEPSPVEPPEPEPAAGPLPPDAVSLAATTEPSRVSADSEGSLVLVLRNELDRPIALPADMTPYLSFTAKFTASDGRLPAASAVAALRPERQETFENLAPGASRQVEVPLAKAVPACKDGCDTGRYELRAVALLGPGEQERAEVELDFWVGPGKAALSARKEATYVKGDARGTKGVKFEVRSAKERWVQDQDSEDSRVELVVRVTNAGRKHVLVPPEKHWAALCESRVVADDGSETRGAEGRGGGTATLGQEEVHDLAPEAYVDLHLECSGNRGSGKLFVKPGIFAPAKVLVDGKAKVKRAVIEATGLPEVEVQR